MSHPDQMRKAAVELRAFVHDDILKKTANPLVQGIMKLLAPVFKSLGEEAMEAAQSLPPAMWSRIIPMMLRQGSPEGMDKEAFAPLAGLAMRALAPMALTKMLGDDPEADGEMEASMEGDDKEAFAPLAGLALRTLAPMALTKMMSDSPDEGEVEASSEDEDTKGFVPLAGLTLMKMMSDDDEEVPSEAMAVSAMVPLSVMALSTALPFAVDHYAGSNKKAASMIVREATARILSASGVSNPVATTKVLWKVREAALSSANADKIVASANALFSDLATCMYALRNDL